MAAIGVALGLALIPVLYSGLFLQAALGPLVFALVRGLFLLPELTALYIVRRPGAAGRSLSWLSCEPGAPRS